MAPPRILVADDDAWILRMVTTVLEKRGYVVHVANDGQEALDRAGDFDPDLIITDVMMPRMDGWAFVKALRAKPEFAFVPVIFLTALSSDDDRIRGFRLGADDYLPKPFRFEELDLRVANTLKRRQIIERAAREQLGASPPVAVPEETPMPVVESSGPHMGLAGTLDQVGLPSLLTLLELERKTGILVLSDAESNDTGRVFVRGGRVICARFDDKGEPANEECVYALLNWSSGRFSFQATDLDMDDEVNQTTTHLLMEGARRIDEEGL